MCHFSQASADLSPDPHCTPCNPHQLLRVDSGEGERDSTRLWDLSSPILGDSITGVPQAVPPALNRGSVGWAHLGAPRLVLVGFELLREGFPEALLLDELQE